MSSLDTELSCHDQSAMCIATVDGSVTIGELRLRAAIMRERMMAVRGRRVALSGLSPAKMMEAVVALDGYAEGMLLVPAGIESDIRQKLIVSAQCDYILQEGEGLGSTEAGIACMKQEGSPTKWMLATSGTTGVPKIIFHTLASLTRTVKRDASRGSAFMWGLMYDPCRFAGLQVVLQSLIGGSCLALSASTSFEDQVATLIAQKVNALSATPTLWRKLLMDGRILELPIKRITLGGETVDQVLLDGLSKRFPEARIVHIYASTEAGVAFSVQDGRAGFPASWLNCANSPVPLRIGQAGHLLIKTAEMPSGEEVLKRLEADGFLDTQDVVRVEGDRVIFMGRASGAINVGGNKVHPEAVERVIREVPNVLNVRVFAKTSSLMGQLVAAEVVAEAGVDEKMVRQQIQRHCRDNLEPWQCPALILLVNQLQETAAGKIRRVG